MSRIPAKIVSLIGTGQPKSNIDVIVDYLVAEQGAVQLTPVQEDLLKRLEKVDELYRMEQYTSKEIAQVHAKAFGQSVSQSRRDMEAAEFVFGSTRKTNKRYALGRHVANIQDMIVKYTRLGYHELVPKLLDCLTKALSLMPEDKSDVAPPAAIIMNFDAAAAEALRKMYPITDIEAEVVATEILRERGIDLEEGNDE